MVVLVGPHQQQQRLQHAAMKSRQEQSQLLAATALVLLLVALPASLRFQQLRAPSRSSSNSSRMAVCGSSLTTHLVLPQ